MSPKAILSILVFTLATSLSLVRADDEQWDVGDGDTATVEQSGDITDGESSADMDDSDGDVEGDVEGESTAETEQAEESANDSGEVTTEIIRERYPSSAIKIERHVAQDADGNYYNHGPWTYWDVSGNLIAQGEFCNGKRVGKWTRWYGKTEAPLFSGPAFEGFQVPFGTEATFADGELIGTWSVYDAKKRTVCTWEFDRGERHGRSTWFFPNGHRRQEMMYHHGQIDGEVVHWDHEDKIVGRDQYVKGRKYAPVTNWHASKKKKSEGWYLYAREMDGATYDWWTGSVTIIPATKDQVNNRHGQWTWWYATGLKQLEGAYDEDKPIGKFTWWFANGQKQIEGEYVAGKQKGKFTWWYANGQKQLEREYIEGVAQGKWKRWSEDGKVIDVGEYAEDGQPLVPAPSVGVADPRLELPTADARTQNANQAPAEFKRF